ncbi:MAG: helix-turn-helix domain-containing protein [Comamonas sp.]
MMETASMTVPDKQFASTLAKGLEILMCFTPEQSFLGNKEFVARTGLDKATVSRLTYTLTQLGYLRHDIKQGKYRLGAPVLSMGYPLLASMNLRQLIRPWIKDLADEIGGMVGVSIRDRTNMVYMETCRSESINAPPIDIGASFPIVVSANGHAWLARASTEEREKVLNQVKVLYPHLYAERIAQVKQALRDFALHGYCASLGYTRKGRISLAVPMAMPVNNEIVVFNCAIALEGAALPSDYARLGTRLVTLVRNVEVALDLV